MYYSPILFSQIADLSLTPFHTTNIDMKLLNLRDNIIIFCLHSMGYINLLNIFLDNVKKPFILITAMEDTQMPLEICPIFLNRIIHNPLFKHWFSINKTIPNNFQFTSIPYGLNYWTLTTQSNFGERIQTINTQNLTLFSIINNSLHFTQRIPKIFVNFHLNNTDERHGGWRQKLIHILPTNTTVYQSKKISRTETYLNMSKYSFIVSPFGHGFDCIRTFEALCLGCIVIMKKSFLDIVYEDLPILVVDEWEDINEKLLNDTLLLYSTKQFNYEKLKMEYWVQVVKSKF